MIKKIFYIILILSQINSKKKNKNQTRKVIIRTGTDFLNTVQIGPIILLKRGPKKEVFNITGNPKNSLIFKNINRKTYLLFLNNEGGAEFLTFKQMGLKKNVKKQWRFFDIVESKKDKNIILKSKSLKDPEGIKRAKKVLMINGYEMNFHDIVNRKYLEIKDMEIVV